MPLSAPGTRPTLLLTLASTGGYPSPISVGKVISVPEPTTVLMVPAATPAPKMAKAWATGMLTAQRYPPPSRRPVPRQRDHHDTAHCHPRAHVSGGHRAALSQVNQTGGAPVMTDQLVSGGKGLRVYPPPPKDFDPFTASAVDLRRHGLPLRPDPRVQPGLAALWERLAARYRGFEHLEPRLEPATAAGEAATPTAISGVDPRYSCAYGLTSTTAAPFTALFVTRTVPDLRF